MRACVRASVCESVYLPVCVCVSVSVCACAMLLNTAFSMHTSYALVYVGHIENAGAAEDNAAAEDRQALRPRDGLSHAYGLNTRNGIAVTGQDDVAILQALCYIDENTARALLEKYGNVPNAEREFLAHRANHPAIANLAMSRVREDEASFSPASASASASTTASTSASASDQTFLNQFFPLAAAAATASATPATSPPPLTPTSATTTATATAIAAAARPLSVDLTLSEDDATAAPPSYDDFINGGSWTAASISADETDTIDLPAVAEMAACDKNALCKGFNTDGYLKACVRTSCGAVVKTLPDHPHLVSCFRSATPYVYVIFRPLHAAVYTWYNLHVSASASASTSGCVSGSG